MTVRNGKGGKARIIPVEPDQAQYILKMKEGRRDNERVFPRIPSHLDVHSYRRDFSQERYLRNAPNHDLPPAEKDRLSSKEYDAAAAEKVSKLLGHNRRSIIIRHYIR